MIDIQELIGPIRMYILGADEEGESGRARDIPYPNKYSRETKTHHLQAFSSFDYEHAQVQYAVNLEHDLVNSLLIPYDS